jgi:hypothetical protein
MQGKASRSSSELGRPAMPWTAGVGHCRPGRQAVLEPDILLVPLLAFDAAGGDWATVAASTIAR